MEGEEGGFGTGVEEEDVMRERVKRGLLGWGISGDLVSFFRVVRRFVTFIIIILPPTIFSLLLKSSNPVGDPNTKRAPSPSPKTTITTAPPPSPPEKSTGVGNR